MFMQSLRWLRRGGTLVSLKVLTDTEDMQRMGMRIPNIVRWLMPLMFARYTRAAKSWCFANRRQDNKRGCDESDDTRYCLR